MDGLEGISASKLMALHINTLYGCDPDGRLRWVNEVGEPPAPRFYMGRTRQGNDWRFRHDLPTATMARLDALCQTEPIASDLAYPPRNYAMLRSTLHDQAPLGAEYRGPAYWITEDTQPSAHVVLITEANAEFVREGFLWMVPLLGAKNTGPIAAALEQGRAVSVCFCARRPMHASEAGVETLAAFRGRGYATAAVARWAAEVRRRGIVPLYSTSWGNLPSQSIARKLRMVLYGEDWWIQ